MTEKTGKTIHQEAAELGFALVRAVIGAEYFEEGWLPDIDADELDTAAKKLFDRMLDEAGKAR